MSLCGIILNIGLLILPEGEAHVGQYSSRGACQPFQAMPGLIRYNVPADGHFFELMGRVIDMMSMCLFVKRRVSESIGLFRKPVFK